MRQYPAKDGPFPVRLHFEPQEMDDMCLQALRDCKFLPGSPSPVRIDAFLEKHFGCHIDYDDFPPEILGCTEFTATGRVQRIAVARALAENPQDDVARRRLNATFAHEGGHGLFHASLFISSGEQRQFVSENVDFKERRILCRPADFNVNGSAARGPYRWWEYQANRAIGGFLMPQLLVFAALESLLQVSPITRTPRLPREDREKAARLIADVFDVNPAAARIRLSGLLPDNDDQGMF
jgi:hypothetical protein